MKAETSQVVAVIFAVLAPAAVQAQTYTVSDQGQAEHKCMYRLWLTEGGNFDGVAFSNDGETLYIRTDGQAINVWEILVYYWPEVLGGLSFVVAVPCLLLLWRVRRRPRIIGEPHCRKCNYCVRGVESGVCPECGQPIRRPIIGRSIWRRVAVPATLLAIVVLGYGGLWAFQVPRSGPASMWLNWWSYGLGDAAKKRGYSLSGWVSPVVRILEVDTQRGCTRRTLITRPAGLRSWIELVTVPSGGLLTTFDNDLVLVDTQSGRVRRKLVGPASGFSRGCSWHQVAGFEDGGQAAYVVQEDAGAKLTRLIRWDLRAGVVSELLTASLDAVTLQGGAQSLWPRQFFDVPHSKPPQFLELPNSMVQGDGWDSKKLDTIRLHEIGPEHRILGEFAASFWGFSKPVFSADGTRVYLLSRRFGQDLTCYTLPHGEPSKSLPAGWAGIVGRCDAALTRIVGAALGRGLLASMFGRSRGEGFMVGDLERGAWIGRFAKPADGLSPAEVHVSPDARYFAARGFLRRRSQSGTREHELLVFDMSSLPHEDVEEEMARQDEYLRALLRRPSNDAGEYP